MWACSAGAIRLASHGPNPTERRVLTRVALPASVPADVEVFALMHDFLRAPTPCAMERLAPGERARHARYRQTSDAIRYVNTRLALRHLLAERVQAAPQHLCFFYGHAGKPALASLPPCASTRHWHFNVSHSGDMSLLALSQSHAVGIDIEAGDAAYPLADIARYAFTESECDAWRNAAHEAANKAAQNGERDDAARAFYAIWTAKEAVVKAWGSGLGAMRNFSVLPPVCGPLRLAAAITREAEATRDEDAAPAMARIVATCAWQLELSHHGAAALALFAPAPDSSASAVGSRPSAFSLSAKDGAAIDT